MAAPQRGAPDPQETEKVRGQAGHGTQRLCPGPRTEAVGPGHPSSQWLGIGEEGPDTDCQVHDQWARPTILRGPPLTKLCGLPHPPLQDGPSRGIPPPTQSPPHLTTQCQSQPCAQTETKAQQACGERPRDQEALQSFRELPSTCLFRGRLRPQPWGLRAALRGWGLVQVGPARKAGPGHPGREPGLQGCGGQLRVKGGARPLLSHTCTRTPRRTRTHAPILTLPYTRTHGCKCRLPNPSISRLELGRTSPASPLPALALRNVLWEVGAQLYPRTSPRTSSATGPAPQRQPRKLGLLCEGAGGPTLSRASLGSTAGLRHVRHRRCARPAIKTIRGSRPRFDALLRPCPEARCSR